METENIGNVQLLQNDTEAIGADMGSFLFKDLSSDIKITHYN